MTLCWRHFKLVTFKTTNVIIKTKSTKSILLSFIRRSNSTTSSSISSHYDIVVIGLGGVGSFALRSLAQDTAGSGGRFLGIDRASISSIIVDDKKQQQKQTTVDNNNNNNTDSSSSYYHFNTGSSNGRTRIYRRAYFEHEHYVPWIDYSLNVFKQLEKQSNINLLQQCGTLIMEESASYKGEMPEYCKSSKLSAKLYNVPYEYYNNQLELKERFPQFQYNPKYQMVGIYEPGGGFIRPERTMSVALQQASYPTNGSIIDLLDHSIVTKISNVKKDNNNNNNPIEIQVIQQQNNKDQMGHTENYTVTTNYLLIAAGSWTGQLIPEWKKKLNVVRQIQTWVDVGQQQQQQSQQQNNNNNHHHMFSYHHMPTFVMCNPDFSEYPLYGIPCDTDDPNASNWLKIGLHKQNGYNTLLNNNPSLNYQQLPTINELNEMKNAISLGINSDVWNEYSSNSNNSSNIDSHFVNVQPCLYTMSPDKHYMIGTPESYRNNIFVIGGLSGHGYKCTPALGQMMIDFVYRPNELLQQNWNIDFCSSKRFHI